MTSTKSPKRERKGKARKSDGPASAPPVRSFTREQLDEMVRRADTVGRRVFPKRKLSAQTLVETVSVQPETSFTNQTGNMGNTQVPFFFVLVLSSFPDPRFLRREFFPYRSSQSVPR